MVESVRPCDEAPHKTVLECIRSPTGSATKFGLDDRQRQQIRRLTTDTYNSTVEAHCPGCCAVHATTLLDLPSRGVSQACTDTIDLLQPSSSWPPDLDLLKHSPSVPTSPISEIPRSWRSSGTHSALGIRRARPVFLHLPSL